MRYASIAMVWGVLVASLVFVSERLHQVNISLLGSVPSYSFVDINAMPPLMGVYWKDGEPHYMRNFSDISEAEYRARSTPEEWQRAQAWIQERRAELQK